MKADLVFVMFISETMWIKSCLKLNPLNSLRCSHPNKFIRRIILHNLRKVKIIASVDCFEQAIKSLNWSRWSVLAQRTLPANYVALRLRPSAYNNLRQQSTSIFIRRKQFILPRILEADSLYSDACQILFQFENLNCQQYPFSRL